MCIRDRLTHWSDLVTTVPDPDSTDPFLTREESRAELIECVEYFDGLFEERRRNPGFDLVSMLAHGEPTRDMQPMEHLGNLILLIVGGNDTTRNTMSGSVYALDRWPDQFEKLKADHSLITNFVPEVIRW